MKPNKAININTKYDWEYVIPGSDRFFGATSLDEWVPVDGNEDRRVLDAVYPGKTKNARLELEAHREPMPDGGAQSNPVRLRYTRVLPLSIGLEATGPGFAMCC